MLNKLIKVIIPVILISIILLISLKTYNDTKNSQTNFLTLLPENTSLVLKINNLDKFKSINSYKIINKLKNLIDINFLINNSETFKSVLQHELLLDIKSLNISLHKTGNNNLSTLFTTQLSNNYISFNKNFEVIEYDKKNIYTTEFNDNKFHFYNYENILFFSKSKFIIEEVIKTQSSSYNLINDLTFQSSYKTINNNADANIMINFKELANTSSVFFKNKLVINNFSSWSCNDLEIKNDLIIANGFLSTNKKIEHYTDILENQEPKKIKITEIIPENTSDLFSIGFNDAKLLLENKNKLLQKNNNFWNWDKHRKSLLDSTNVNYNELIKKIDSEAGNFKTSHLNSSHSYNYFKSNNSVVLISYLQPIIKKIKTYNNKNIYYCLDQNLTHNLFGPIIKTNTSYFTIINDYFVFSDNANSIKYLIDNFISKNTLINSNHFTKYNTLLSQKSNLTIYSNPGKSFQKLHHDLRNDYKNNIKVNKDSISNITGLSLQISNKGKLFSSDFILFYDRDFKQNLQEEWVVRIDTQIITKPYFVKNHFTKDKMILFQDTSNTLFAYSAKGKLVWKKKLNNKIIGEINSIDFYKNNKYQCIFNTNSNLHIIDRNGNYVENYPIKLPVKTKIGHSLFDYNNKKKYRIIVVGDDNMIYNFDKFGKKVVGWKYKKQNNRIFKSPKHFKFKTKDYILIETRSKNIKLLAINGTERVILSSESILNGSDIKISKNGCLYAITSDAKLWKGKLDGNSTETIIPNLNNKSKFTVLNNNFIFSNGNKVYSIDDEFDNLFTLNFETDINNISVFKDFLLIETANNLFLYDNDKIVNGSPIKISGIFNVDDVDNNNKTNIINVLNNSIYNYELFD